MSDDFRRIIVPAPEKNSPPVIEGNGWELRLNPGWAVGAGERKGDFVVRPER